MKMKKTKFIIKTIASFFGFVFAFYFLGFDGGFSDEIAHYEQLEAQVEVLTREVESLATATETQEAKAKLTDLTKQLESDKRERERLQAEVAAQKTELGENN